MYRRRRKRNRQDAEGAKVLFYISGLVRPRVHEGLSWRSNLADNYRVSVGSPRTVFFFLGERMIFLGVLAPLCGVGGFFLFNRFENQDTTVLFPNDIVPKPAHVSLF